MGLDYVDIFYHHRPDPETPLEETMLALDGIVKSGKALYVGISASYTLLLAEISDLMYYLYDLIITSSNLGDPLLFEK